MKTKIVRYVAIFLVTLVLLAACNFSSAPELERPPLKFAYSEWPGFFPIAIAQAKGFFTQQGVNVTSVIRENGKGILTDFGAGKFDGILLSLGEAIPISATNPDIRIVLVTGESSGADAIVAQKQIKTVADLKGKIIAAGLGSFGELFVTKMLEINGLTADDVKLVNAYGEQVPQRLKSGSIQAGHTWEPYVSQLVKTGNRVLFTSQQKPGLMPDVMAFQGNVVRDRPSDIRAFMRAWFQAVEYWQAHPQEGNAIIKRVFHLPSNTVSIAGVKLLTLNDNKKAFTPGTTTASLFYTTQLYTDFYIRTGDLARSPDINKIIDPAFVK